MEKTKGKIKKIIQLIKIIKLILIQKLTMRISKSKMMQFQSTKYIQMKQKNLTKLMFL